MQLDSQALLSTVLSLFKEKTKRLGTELDLRQSEGFPVDPSHENANANDQSSFCTCNVSISNYEINYYEMGFAFVLSKRIVFLKKFKSCVPLWCLTKKNTSPC